MDVGMLLSDPFDAVKDALFDYKSQPDPERIKELRMMVHGYLREMNANKGIPLSHRLQVIDTLDQYIGILQDLGVPNLLETYDRVIAEVSERAQKKPEFVEALVEIATYCFHIVLQDLQNTLLRYYPVSPVAVRRALHLVHTVLRLHHQHKLPSNPWLIRISRLFIMHELLRAVNTYAMPRHEQKAAVRQLRKHLEAGVKASIRFHPEGDRIQSQGLALIVLPLKPHAAPKRVLRYDETAQEDTIFLDLDQLAQVALRDMRHAESKIGPQQRGEHGDYVMVADVLHDAIVFGRFMREIMYTRPRQYPRRRPEQKNSVALDTDIQRGLRTLYEQQRIMDGDGCIETPEAERTWHVVDISEGGFYLEQMHVRKRPRSTLALEIGTAEEEKEEVGEQMEVGILVSYTLLAPQPTITGERPKMRILERGVARISWYRVNANELKSIGVAKIMQGTIAHVRVARELLSVSAQDQFFAWVDVENGTQARMWSTQQSLSPGTPLAIRIEGRKAFSCTVAKMLERGMNYAVHLLNIDPPKERPTP